MLTRYRWYKIKLPRKEFDLSSMIVGRPLTREANSGFVRVEDGGDVSKFRFLWRTKILIARLDDEGAPRYEEIESVSFKDFAVIDVKGMTFLRVENPGRNLRDMLNALESMIGLGFSSEPLTFEKGRPTSVFDNVESSKLVGLKVVGAVIQEDLVARMEFASKQGMVIESMKLLDGLRYNVESAVFELIHQGVRGQLAFSSSGVVKVSGQLSPKLVSLIEDDLPKLA
ncbi:hypothetical protein [Burkholderia cepacia]|uniref:hypothetical protein n=1 Tax=Burkholderia cepacia TaxID=292 RepID=UPI00264C9565|nr:hypothetical protein [Burkholderia cepacia]MDN7909078.1 hypothetical protein [Burkholderia cepacia]